MRDKMRFCTVVLARPKERLVAGWESPFEVFTFDITSRWDEPHSFSAESDLFGESVIGVGTNHQRAVEDLVGAVVVLLEAHLASGTYEGFLGTLLERNKDTPLLAAPDHPTRQGEPWLHSILSRPEPLPQVQPQPVLSTKTAAGQA